LHGHPGPAQADAELEFLGSATAESRLEDELGRPVAVQRTRSFATVGGSRGRLVFRAELPPLGYRTYRLSRGEQVTQCYLRSETALENEHLALELDARGRIVRLELRETGAQLVGDGPHAVVIDDRSDTWGHRVRAYDDAIGEF